MRLFLYGFVALGLAACASGTPPPQEQAKPTAELSKTEAGEVAALNRLVSILIDANTLYHEAAEIPDEPGISPLIEEIAIKRDRQREELQKIVMQIGGTPDKMGEALGTGHRAFMRSRALMENDSKVAIEEVLRGEYYIIEVVDGCIETDATDASMSWLQGLRSDTQADITRLESLLKTVK